MSGGRGLTIFITGLPAMGLFIVLVVAPLVAAGVASMLLYRPDGRVVEVEMRQTAGAAAAQLFWSPAWVFDERDSNVVALRADPDEFQRVRFTLPDRPLLFIRFDPIDAPGEVIIRAVRVLDADERTIRTIDPILLTPLHQVESMMPDGDGVRLTTTKDATDPMLLLRSVWLLAPPTWHSLALVSTFSLVWTASACVVLVAVGMWLIAREAFSNEGARRVQTALWFGALFLGTVSAKLMLLDLFPSPVPLWDQWDGEAVALYLPFANGGLSWQQMFALHNEHRIFFSRLLAVSLVALNGQWDPHLQIAVNAVLHALVAVVLTATLWLAAGRRWLPLWVIALALIFVPPFAMGNTLSGFQSAFYFLVLFSGFAFWGMGLHRPGTPPWLLGWLSAFCCLFTVGGGVAIVVGLGVLLSLKAMTSRDWRRGLVDLAALAAVGALGYATLSPPWPAHEILRAGTWLAFRTSLARNLAFPWIGTPRASVVVWIPQLAVAAVVLYRRLRAKPLEQFALALGLWVAFQAAAVAYSRGAGGAAPASRYFDMLSFGLVANTAALAAMLDWRDARWYRITARCVLALWVAVGALGTKQLSEVILEREGPQRIADMREYVRNLRKFLMTGDVAAIASKQGPYEIPHFNARLLAGWLSHPYVRHVLPAAVHEPLAITPAAPDAPGFSVAPSPDDMFPVWDSYTVARAKALGHIESQPIDCREHRHLRFEVAGALREPGLRLFLREIESGNETVVRPRTGASQWDGVVTRCPDTPFAIVAIDDSPTAWFAFKAPTEMAWLSAIAETVIQQSRVLGGIAVGLTIVVLAAAIRTRRLPTG